MVGEGNGVGADVVVSQEHECGENVHVIVDELMDTKTPFGNCELISTLFFFPIIFTYVY